MNINKKFLLSKQELEELYLVNKLSSLKIAKQLNISKPTVLRWLRRYEIKIRTTSESLKGNICGENHPMYGKKHEQESKEKMKESRKKGLENGSIKIWSKGLTKEIDKRLDYERPTCWKEGETSGEKNHNWLGGKSFEPYGLEFNSKLKNIIRKRDNQICMNCGIHREKLNYALSVHHINYDKECSIEQNLISLCKKCHNLTNKNREYWIDLFQSLLLKRYDYKYKNRDIILEMKNEI